MLTEIACLIASTLLLCWSLATYQQHATCPGGWPTSGGVATWHVAMALPGGYFECRRVPGGDPEYDGTHGKPDRSYDLPGTLRSRLWCTSGSYLHQDGHSVWCSR